MARNLLLILRIGLVLVATGLLVFLLMRGELSPQLRVILVAALVFYVVRLWLTASRMRRERVRARQTGSGEKRLVEDEQGERL